MLAPTLLAFSAAPDEPAVVSLYALTEQLLPGQQLELDITAAGLDGDSYYVDMQLQFDPERFAFVEIEPGELMGEGALSIGQLLDHRTVGASVSRTDDEQPVSDSGTLMRIRMVVLDQPPAGAGVFTLQQASLAGSTGDELALQFGETERTVQVLPYLRSAELIAPASTELIRGEQVPLTLQTDAGELAEEPDAGDRVMAWLGVHDQLMEPAQWPGSAWQPAAFDESSGEHLTYQALFDGDRDYGTWYAAVRFQLDDRDPVYGARHAGDGRFWGEQGVEAAQLQIVRQRLVLAGWDFNAESWLASAGMHENRDQVFQLHGATHNGWTGGVDGGRALNSRNWHEEEASYWMAQLSARGMEALQVRFHMSSSNTGPARFQLQYRPDEDSGWLDSGDTLHVSNTFRPFDQPLPPEAAGAAELELRWLRIDTVAVNGSAIGSSGSHQIDRVHVSGILADPQPATVWPGDTNQSGVVNEQDVLALGQYWNASGPLRMNAGLEWASQQGKQWLPAAATHADTNGDGVVDHRDLQAIGLNFGREGGEEQAGEGIAVAGQGAAKQDAGAPLAAVALPPMHPGQTHRVRLTSEAPIRLSGASYHLQVTGVDGERFRFQRVSTASWTESWSEQQRLITFNRETSAGYSGAQVHQGAGVTAQAEELLEVELKALSRWPRQARLELIRFTALDKEGRQTAGDRLPLRLTVEQQQSGGDPPQGPTELLAAYPNPFTGQVHIPYRVQQAGHVRIQVYDMLGRRLAMIVDASHEPGYYTKTWRAGSVPSGSYILHLRASERSPGHEPHSYRKILLAR